MHLDCLLRDSERRGERAGECGHQEAAAVDVGTVGRTRSRRQAGRRVFRSRRAVDHIFNAPGFTDKERRAMRGETAAKLLGIKL